MAKKAKAAEVAVNSMLAAPGKGKRKKGMSKCQIAAVLSTMCNQTQCAMETFLDTLAKLAIEELRDKNKFEIPGIALIKNIHKPARKAGKITFLGQKFNLKAKKACFIVKAYPIFPLKREVERLSSK